jgi:hypothetical protein
MLVRQARLRTEWGSLYPALRTGEWEAAAVLGDRLLAESLLKGSVVALQGRMLPDAHFEFRGGVARGGERAGLRSRLGMRKSK